MLSSSLRTRYITFMNSMYRRAKALFAKVEPKLLGAHDEEFVALEPDSGDYLVGKNELRVVLKAIKRHPGKKFGFFRVGQPAVYKLRKTTHPCRSGASHRRVTPFSRSL